MPQDVIAFDGFQVAVDLDTWPAKILRALLRRHYEKHELRLVSRLLKPTDRVLELGSAIGVVALAASRVVPAQNIVCFDANPDMVEEARRNFDLNGKAITAHNAVLVADDTGPTELTFYKSPYFLSSSLMNRRGDAQPVGVPTRSLSSTLKETQSNVLIVDIEGGEFDLLGSADLSSIETLVLELHVSLASVKHCNKLIADLASQGLVLDTAITAYNVFVFKRSHPPDLSDADGKRFTTAYLAGLELWDAGEAADAAVQIAQATQINPGNAFAHLLLSQILAADTVDERVLTAAKSAVEIDPTNEDALEHLAVVCSALSAPGEAEAAYKSAILQVPFRPLFRVGLGAVQARGGNADEALEAFAIAVAQNPPRANTLEHLLSLAQRQDKFSGDNDVDQPACPDDTRRFLLALADSVEQNFRFPDAASALRWALELAPESTELHCGLASLLATPKDIKNTLKTIV